MIERPEQESQVMASQSPDLIYMYNYIWKSAQNLLLITTYLTFSLCDEATHLKRKFMDTMF